MATVADGRHPTGMHSCNIHTLPNHHENVIIELDVAQHNTDKHSYLSVLVILY